MKKNLISILTLIFIILISSYSYAANTATATLSLSKETIKAGDEFFLIVNAADSNNLNTVEYTAVTIADESGNAVPAISIKSVESVGENWSKINAEGKINFVYSGGTTQSSEVFKVTFKVGDSIAEGNYVINVEGIKIYSAQDDETAIGTKNISVRAIIDDTTAGNQGGSTGGEQTPGENQGDGSNGGEQTPGGTGNDGSNGGTQDGNPSNSGNNGGNTDDNKPNSGSEDKNTNKDKDVNTNKKPTKLPQTGAESASIIAIIALGAISIVSYVSYRKYKNI